MADTEYAEPDPALMGGDPSPDPSPAATPTPSAPTGDYDVVDPLRNDTPVETVAAKPEVPEPTPEAIAAAAKPAISPEIQQRAANLGMTLDELATYSDPAKAVISAENVAFRAQQAVHAQLQAQQFANQPKPQPPQPPKQPDFSAMKADLVAQGYEEKATEAIVGLAKQNYANALDTFNQNQWLHQFHQWAQGTEQRLQAQSQQHQVEIAQRDFADFKKSLDPEMQNLITADAEKQIWQTADAFARGYAAQGQTPQFKQLFEQAMYATLGQKLQGVAVSKVRTEVKTAQGRAVSRPRGADGKRSEGEAGARSFANKFYAEKFGSAQGAMSSADV